MVWWRPRGRRTATGWRFEIRRGRLGRWRWLMRDHNGRTVAVSSVRGWKTRSEAVEAAVRFKSMSGSAVIADEQVNRSRY